MVRSFAGCRRPRSRRCSKPWASAVNSKCSRGVRRSNRPGSSVTRPMTERTPWGSARRSNPPISASPASGVSKVDTTRMVVVLPAPFGPKSSVITPGGASNDRPSSTRWSPSVFSMPRSLITRPNSTRDSRSPAGGQSPRSRRKRSTCSMSSADSVGSTGRSSGSPDACASSWRCSSEATYERVSSSSSTSSLIWRS